MSSLVTPMTFSGQSKFAGDFQQIINRAVQIQSLPLTLLQNQQTNDQNQLSAITSLDQAFTSLQSAITGLTTAVGAGSYSGSVADPKIASVSLGANATSGVYSLEVETLGSATQTISASGLQKITDPTTQNISSASSFQLTVGPATTPTTITPTGNTLQDLVNALNGDSSLGVSASIVNVGAPGSPDYRLAVQSTSLGKIGITLADGPTQLLTPISSGEPATYKVDNLPDAITCSSRAITLAPGVTVNFLGSSAVGVPTTVTVQQTTTSAQSALQQLATAYNAVVTQLATQHGQNAGPLAGSSILQTAQSVLRNINSYNSSGGSVQTLKDIGLDLDATGKLTFNASEFSAGGGANVSALSKFLGNSTSGFLGNMTSAVKSLEDSNSGTLKNQETSLNSSLTKLAAKMNDQINAVNLFQQNLAEQLSKSDAVIATLSTQVTYFQDLFFPNANGSSS